MNKKPFLVYYSIAIVLILLGFGLLFIRQSEMMDKENEKIENKEAIVLSPELNRKSLSDFLVSQDYVSDETDARIISDWIAGRMADRGELPNLGTLNKNDYKIPVQYAEQRGGNGLRKRAEMAYTTIGLTPEVDSIYASHQVLEPIIQGTADAEIMVSVLIDDSVNHGIWNKIKRELSGVKPHPESGVLVRLKEHYYDTIPSHFSYGENNARDSIIGYAFTDRSGNVRFRISKGHYYSVLPIRRGYEYGMSKGTIYKALDEDPISYTFTQRKHVMTLFDGVTYRKIKEDQSIVVRSPNDYKDMFIIGFVQYLLAWCLFIFLTHFFVDQRNVFRSTKRNRSNNTSKYVNDIEQPKLQTDSFIIFILILLSGVGLLTMYAFSRPLTDMPLGFDTANGITWGLVGMFFFSQINPVKFFNGHSALQIVRTPTLISKIHELIPKGLGHLGIAYSRGFSFVLWSVFFIILLALFGTGPEGSDAHVNLFGFQPSEISKYLIVIFMACFFADNANVSMLFNTDAIQTSGVISGTLRRLVHSLFLFVIFGVLCLLYLKVLSDMGPALVLIVTFIMLYAMGLCEMKELFVGCVTFIAMLVLANKINPTSTTMTSFALLWLLGWTLWGWTKKRFYDSAILMNTLIFMFLVGGDILVQLGYTEGYRLKNRVDIAWNGVWNNEVPGGDQVAQGLWSLASGGFSGQGIGHGHPNLVPAGHTDMVFTSIGEIAGWIGVAFVVFLFYLLIRHMLKLALKNGFRFGYFLVTGFALVTGVQFLVIVLGSIGWIPLTGVSVPFLSYGKSGMIVNLTMFGLILSLSRIKGTTTLFKDTRLYSEGNKLSTYFFGSIFTILVLGLFYVQVLNQNKFLLRPAFLTNIQGSRNVVYNPRIDLVIKKMESGNIYDCNGLLLATSSHDELLSHRNELINAGLNSNLLRQLAAQHNRRYYPFGVHTLFMLGDFNTRTVWSNSGGRDNNPIGYLAEAHHLTDLRGFDNIKRDNMGNPCTKVLKSNHYRGSRFLNGISREDEFVLRDYHFLLDMLKSGGEEDELVEYNKSRPQRDITLTLDARLQMLLQERLETYITNTNPSFRNHNRLRASVVVLNAQNGDLLSSAVYPLPNQDTLQLLRDLRIFGDIPHERMEYVHTPITERDLGLTYQTQPGSTAKVASALAGLRELGTAAANITYYIDPRETVEPPTKEPTGNVTMRDAIVQSSNNYFINLVHNRHLYNQLDTLYQLFGGRIYHERDMAPVYYFTRDEITDEDHVHYSNIMHQTEMLGMQKYDSYMAQRNVRNVNTLKRMSWSQTAIAWGQEPLRTSPLNMARLASTVANHGQYVPTRYVLRIGDKPQEPIQPISVLSSDAADILRSYMQQESDKHRNNRTNPIALPNRSDLPLRMGGKTGTPERGDQKGKQPNDGWYICFIQSDRVNAPLAIALRLERLEKLGSKTAVRTIADAIIPALNAAGYQVQ